jgi:hypothetical protein
MATARACRFPRPSTKRTSASATQRHASRSQTSLGEKFALENAKKALWPLMGYALREKLARADER